MGGGNSHFLFRAQYCCSTFNRTQWNQYSCSTMVPDNLPALTMQAFALQLACEGMEMTFPASGGMFPGGRDDLQREGEGVRVADNAGEVLECR